jgi:hypothetical protein
MGINEQQKTEDTSQEVLNKSVDPRFGILAVELLGYDTPNDTVRRVAVDENGQLEVGFDYRISDISGNYYGFTKADGAWYIMEFTGSTARYIKGDSDYTTSWTGRAGLTYGYFYDIF